MFPPFLLVFGCGLKRDLSHPTADLEPVDIFCLSLLSGGMMEVNHHARLLHPFKQDLFQSRSTLIPGIPSIP